ncbi:signal recognition particle protein Srp19, partial [Candidatus Woesearchaeota archaeon CG_4_10_14_0_2_um_filter_57_5]
RISIGSGVEAPIVRELIKQYRHSKKLVRQLKGMGAGNPKQMQKLMRKMGMNASG